MPGDGDRRRLVVAARGPDESSLRQLFNHPSLHHWELLEANSYERARFLLQYTQCDTLLIDESLYYHEGVEGLQWLARRKEAPLLFLAGGEGEVLTEVYTAGVQLCLPRQLTLARPELLAAALQRTAELTDRDRSHQRVRENLLQCRRQIDRLVSLLWRAAPMDTDRQWLTQRHILERLQEEVARAERHHEPFTIALAEIEAPAPEGKEAAPTLTEWVIDRVSRTKRRCDAAGQYGLRGFLLLLVHTARDGGLICCHRLQKQLEEAENTVEAGSAGPVRACFGIASFSGQSTTPQALLSRAEQQLEIARASDTERVQAD